MRKNPITCRRGGTITLGSSQMNLTSSDGWCNYSAPFPFYNPLTDNTMASIMCAHGEVGQGTIVIGASGSYVIWLASFLNDHDYPQPPDGGVWDGYAYVVTCTVDARDVWEYRTVTLNLQNSNTSDPSYARSLQGHEPCYPTPGTSAINDGLIATSAAANWQILSQNAGDDGLLDLLSDLTDNWRPPPYAFNNSLNALEDALGLISALVASRINSSTTAASNGTAVITATTAGSRKPFAFAFIFPPVAAAIILFYLIVKTRAIKGELLRSSKLKDLIKVGQALGPDVELEEPEDGLLGSAAAHGQSSATELNGQPDDHRCLRLSRGTAYHCLRQRITSRRPRSQMGSETVHRCLRQRMTSRRAWS